MSATRLTTEQATALRELARVPQMYAAPIHTRGPGGEIASGTTFFLECGGGVFGVTAGHVFDQLVANVQKGASCFLGIRVEPFALQNRLISRGREVDIATYRVDLTEVDAAGVRPLSSGQWPPPLPAKDQALRFAGFPGLDRQHSSSETSFSGTTGAGIVDSINDRDISCVLDREDMIPIEGMRFPEPGYDFAGLSGAPVLAIAVDEIVAWHLAGVVYECGRELFEIIKIARADFIGADGFING